MTTDTLLPIADVAAWLRDQEWSDFAQSLADYHDRKGTLTERQLTSARSMMAKVATPKAKPAARVTEDGMYFAPDGDVVKVQFARGTGNLYAKRLVVDHGTTEDHRVTTPATFEYEPGLVHKLDPATKMTHEAAAAWGQLYGMCCVCGALLTNEESIERGIGPICASRF